MTFPGRLFAGALLVLAGMVGVLGEDWPQFLGPRQDGTSLETGLVRAIPTNGLPVVWDRPIGTGYSAPSLLSGMLVVFHREKNEEIIEALDPVTGASRWRHGYPSAYRDPYGYNNGPRCAPILTQQRVYTFGAEGKLTCVERATGKRVWQRDTAKDFNVPEAFFGVGSTPILEGGLLLVMVGGQTDAGVVAFDPETGATRWESVGRKNWQGLPMHGWPGDLKVEWREWEKTASYASLRTATVNGERLLFACMRQGLVALNPTNGAVHFSRWFRARVDDSVNAMTPVVDGNQVLISSAYFRSGSVMLRMEPGNRVFAEMWKGLGLEMHWSQPMLLDGHLYGFSGRNEPDAVLRCVEWATGKVKWERNERWPAHSAEQPPVFGRGSFLLAEGRLIALGEGGLLGMFEPTPAECRELGRWQVPSMKYPCWAAPILSDRRLFLRSEDRLVCLNAAR
jgi:outer membrane protein assembly factor BamB